MGLTRGMKAMIGLSCDTYLDPSLVLHVDAIVSRLAAAIHCLSLTRRSKIVRAVDGWSLPVLHLDEGGRRKNGGGRGGNRHQKDGAKGRQKGGEDVNRRSKEVNAKGRRIPQPGDDPG